MMFYMLREPHNYDSRDRERKSTYRDPQHAVARPKHTIQTSLASMILSVGVRIKEKMINSLNAGTNSRDDTIVLEHK